MELHVVVSGLNWVLTRSGWNSLLQGSVRTRFGLVQTGSGWNWFATRFGYNWVQTIETGSSWTKLLLGLV